MPRGKLIRVSCHQPSPRLARASEWLRSALAHHHCPEPGVENEIVVLATGIDQYIQEVFHHLAHPGRDDAVCAEDFIELCAVLGIAREGEGEAEDDENGDEKSEFREVCSRLPCELPFKEFHSRLCGYFRVRAARSNNNGAGESGWRLPVSVETELVERQIRMRWPRVRRRKRVSFDLSRDHSKPNFARAHRGAEDHQTALEEAAALRELVEDLRSALQGSDARCLALEVALRRKKARGTPACCPPSPSSLAPRNTEAHQRPQTRRDAPWDLDPVLLELNMIRASRDGQLEEAIRFSRRLEEELCLAYQQIRRLEWVESALRQENAHIRRRAEEAREAVKQGMERVRLIQRQAQTVPELQTQISHLESQLYQYSSRCTCLADPILQPFHPTGAEDTCIKTEGECLQRAVEGRAASDEEEEENGQGMKSGEGGQCCVAEVKELVRRLHGCGKGCQHPAVLTLHPGHPRQIPLHTGADRGLCRQGAQPHTRPEEEEECWRKQTEGAHLALLEEKLRGALTLLLQLRSKNVFFMALGKVLIEALDMCSRDGHGPSTEATLF